MYTSPLQLTENTYQLYTMRTTLPCTLRLPGYLARFLTSALLYKLPLCLPSPDSPPPASASVLSRTSPGLLWAPPATLPSLPIFPPSESGPLRQECVTLLDTTAFLSSILLPFCPSSRLFVVPCLFVSSLCSCPVVAAVAPPLLPILSIPYPLPSSTSFLSFPPSHQSSSLFCKRHPLESKRFSSLQRPTQRQKSQSIQLSMPFYANTACN